MKKGLIASIVLLLIVLIPISYVQINKILFKHRVLEYLTTEQHYDQAEIQHIEGVWGKKLPAFYVTVIFNDEPHVMYTYFAHGNVYQFEYGTLDGQQLTPDELLHYEERPTYKYELE